MKNKLIITLIAFMTTFFAYGQDYPKYQIDSTGVKHVVITMEQARYIDTKLDILELMEKNDMLGQGLDSLSVSVVNGLEHVISQQDIEISNLYDLVDNKDEQILNLQSQIANSMLRELTYKAQVTNLDSKINIYEKQVSKLERKVFWGGLSSIVLIISGFLIGTSL